MNNMKKQVVVIHGGDTFKSFDEYVAFLKGFVIDSLDYFRGVSWKDSLGESLGADFDVIAPKMPNKFNAQYLEWKIWFEKIIPLLQNEVTLAGHSLGGIFLAKYLSENNFPKKIKSLHLVAAPYDDESEESLGDFTLKGNLENVSKQVPDIFIYHSKDDYVVPFHEAEKYKKAFPSATLTVFEDRGHFNQENFPELVNTIKLIS